MHFDQNKAANATNCRKKDEDSAKPHQSDCHSIFLSPPTTVLMVLDSLVPSDKGKSGSNSRQAHNGAASAGNLSRW